MSTIGIHKTRIEEMLHCSWISEAGLRRALENATTAQAQASALESREALITSAVAERRVHRCSNNLPQTSFKFGGGAVVEELCFAMKQGSSRMRHDSDNQNVILWMKAFRALKNCQGALFNQNFGRY